MRLVCIKNMVKKYNSKDENFIEIVDRHLIIGKSYETFMTQKEFEICSVVGIYDDLSNEIIGDRVYDKHLFVTIEDWRDIKIKELGI